MNAANVVPDGDGASGWARLAATTLCLVEREQMHVASYDRASKENISRHMHYMNWRSMKIPHDEIRRKASMGAQSVLELMQKNQSLVGIGDPGITVYNHWPRSFL